MDIKPLILGRLRLEDIASGKRDIIRFVQIISFLTDMETVRPVQHKDRHGNTSELQERQRIGIGEPVTNKEMTPHLISTGKAMRSSVACKKPIKDLNSPVIYNVIRVGGRLQLSCLPFESKHPLVLPSNHFVTDLVVMHYHLCNAHSGITHTLNSLRE